MTNHYHWGPGTASTQPGSPKPIASVLPSFRLGIDWQHSHDAATFTRLMCRWGCVQVTKVTSRAILLWPESNTAVNFPTFPMRFSVSLTPLWPALIFIRAHSSKKSPLISAWAPGQSWFPIIKSSLQQLSLGVRLFPAAYRFFFFFSVHGISTRKLNPSSGTPAEPQECLRFRSRHVLEDLIEDGLSWHDPKKARVSGLSKRVTKRFAGIRRTP